MNKRLLFFLFFLPFWSFSQDSTTYEIATDRPSVSNSAFTTPKGFLIAETGYFQNKFRLGTFYIPSIFLRYGISKRVEARLGDEYSHLSQTIFSIPLTISNFLPISVGLKYRINNPEQEKFALSVLWTSKIPIPTSLEKTALRHYGKALMQYNFASKWYTFSNMGLEFLNIQTNITQFAYTLGIGSNITNGFYTYFETFGYEPFQKSISVSSSHNANIGMIYIIKKRYQLDASFGGDWNQPLSTYHFFNVGFSTYLKINAK
jgi:Putative MetA-pathway of phenol degradation